MNRTLIASLRTLLADPDRPDRDTLFAVLTDTRTSYALACLAPPGSLVQIAAALRRGWSWDCDGWNRQTDELVGLITDPRCSVHEQMIRTWSDVPDAVGVLRDRTAPLIAWAQQLRATGTDSNLALLLGPSDKSARLLMQFPSSLGIGRTLRRWSMAISPDDPTAWQAMIDPDLRAALHQNASLSWAFPAWEGDDAVIAGEILREIVDDLVAGWSPDHPSIRRRIGWLEHHVFSYLHIEHLAIVASIGGSDTLAEAVCARLGHNPSAMDRIAKTVPWNRLHPRIQTVIDETMQQSSDAQWKRTWACAIGRSPLVTNTTIDANLLLWRITPERWDALDAALRAALVSRITFSGHCFGWGVHPDLVRGKYCPNDRNVRFWNPDVSPDDLRAWAYADLLHAQRTLQESRILIDLLMTLPPDRRARFEQIIDGRLGSRPEATAQPPWDWMTWASLPAVDRQRRLRDRLRVLWGDRTTKPAYRIWMARSHLLDTVAVAIRDLLDSKQAPRILAALLAQVPALQVHMPNPGPPLPFPNNLDAALRAQIERLPLAPDVQAYAAWCLRVLEQDMGLGSTLIALHPDVAVALAPLLNADQQKTVAASPATQGWDSMTQMRWTVTCENTEISIPPRIQRMIR